VIVEPTAGTTMDAIDAHWNTPAGAFVLVDTAGIRRQAHFRDQPEYFSTLRALQALERADVACLVVDATRGFERQEARLAQDAFDAAGRCSSSTTSGTWSSNASNAGRSCRPTARAATRRSPICRPCRSRPRAARTSTAFPA